MDEQQNFSMGPMEVRQPALIEAQIIKRIPTYKEAIRQCIYLSGMTVKGIAHELEIDQGHMSRIMSNSAHFPDDKLPDLMTTCANYAPLQWLAWRMGFALSKQTAQQREIEELETRLAELRRVS